MFRGRYGWVLCVLIFISTSSRPQLCRVCRVVKPIILKSDASPMTQTATNAYIFTARKRSLGQGNVLTVVCLSTGGGWLPSMHHRSHDQEVCPTPLDNPPPPQWTLRDTIKRRAVRILLQCIFVILKIENM